MNGDKPLPCYDSKKYLPHFQVLQTACCTFYSYNVDSLHSGIKESVNCKHKGEYGYIPHCEHCKKAHLRCMAKAYKTMHKNA